MTLILALQAASLLSATVCGTVLRVPDQYATIQDAINSAVPSDTVEVRAGTYPENINLRNGIVILGGWNADFTRRDPARFVTTVDGHSNGSTVTAFWPVDSTSVLDGFKIVNGTGTEDPLNPGTYMGGGILVYNTPGPRILNNEIRDNAVSGGSGGGICSHDSSPIIKGNTIVNNQCAGFGAGLSLGNNCCGRIIGNIIANNIAVGDGGGIRADLGAFLLEGNKIYGNRAGINGGGISMDHSAAHVAENEIYANRAQALGGGIFGYAISSVIDHNLVRDNTAGASGGILCLAVPVPLVQFNTITGNSSNEAGQVSFGEACSATLDHNIITCSRNGPGFSCTSDCAPIIACNDIWGNLGGNYGGSCPDQTGQAGNISADPMFCNISDHDYSLASGSPALVDSCGPIGFMGVHGCESQSHQSCDQIAVQKNSWGIIKSLYDK